MSRRMGGRATRVAARQAPLEVDLQPIWRGMKSGRLSLFTAEEREQIAETAFNILENIGFAEPLQSTIDYCSKLGATMKNGRLCFPKNMVKDCVAMANKKFTLYGLDPEWDLQPYDERVYYGTAGAAVHMVDPYTMEYRESLLQDLYQAAKICDHMDNIHFFQRTLVPRDLPDPLDMDFNTCYASVRGSRKHVGTSWVDPKHFDLSLAMLHEIAGGKEQWLARPFVSQSCCFVVPPLKFAQDACRCLERAALEGMPILLISAGQAGATVPASLAGAVALATAEVLAGLCYVNAVKAGAPAMFGTWPFVSDLRSGAMSGGSAEQSLLMSGVGEMGKYFGLISAVASGMADSKIPDYQAGAEKAYNHAIVAQSGANLVYESAGMHASLLGFCLESLVLDNDLLGSVSRIIRGIEVNDETLSYETIRSVCIDGPGHFLGSAQTLKVMQKDYFYPQTFDRASPKEWAANNKPTALDKARGIKEKLLALDPHGFVDPALDKELRKRYPIKLPEAHL
ncbi:MAG: trimethylamine methyltransferase family protein [Hydrotalea sp.]|nr:trimethylamine methyltransferase family protein [Hydrotalea sp.]